MATNSISNSDDYLDSRDIQERINELESFKDDPLEDIQNPDSEDAQELASLLKLKQECDGQTGESWEDGIQFIRESYFEHYARELAEDIGAITTHGEGWPLNHIDWKRAADALKMDYTEIDFDGVIYLARC